MRKILGTAVGCLAFASVLAPTSAEARYYYSPTGFWDVRGAIEAEWLRLGGTGSILGPPAMHETPTPRRSGAYSHFQGGSIYWSSATGAQEVRGAIRDRWASLGWENSALGFPVTNESPTPDGWGRYNHFQGGSIYWSSATGAQEVRGAIRAAWASMGSEDSLLGYPVSDEYVVPGGRRSDFEHGSLVWTPVDGVALDMTLTGSGDAHIPIPPGPFAVDVAFEGNGEAVVETVEPSWTTANLITSGVGPWRRTALGNLGGQAATGLLLTADGDWTVGLVPLSELPTIGPGQVASGSEGSVLHYTGPPGQLRFEATEPNAQVQIFTRTAVYVETLWANDGPAYWPVGEDIFVELRQADAPWTVVVEPY